MIVYYEDAEVSGEYPGMGYFDDTGEFREAVENNPAYWKAGIQKWF